MKTGMITELLNNWGEVNLFTRPRRFGKSLNMSMLKHFFSYDCDRSLFDGLEIAGEAALCEAYMGKYPVLSISLKGVSDRTFAGAKGMMAAEISREAKQFQFLKESDRLTEVDKRTYARLLDEESLIRQNAFLYNSLRDLSFLLYKHYGQRVIILIDEYDVPLDKAFQFGYYDEMTELVRNLFNQALKSNSALMFSVLTGCLRISRESIFTCQSMQEKDPVDLSIAGLNNPQIFSIADVQFNEYFGFTDEEVKTLLEAYDQTEHYEVMKQWYDGYHFGNVEVYCPWDVMNYCAALRTDSGAQPKDYWINTSGNDIVKRFITKAGNATTKWEIEELIAGNTIQKEIHQELTYKDLDKKLANMWSVLFTTGYLTCDGQPDSDMYTLRIPNLEIRRIFIRQIYSWFQENAVQDGTTLNAFCDAFEKGKDEEIQKQFQVYLAKTISIRDTFVPKQRKENFYHGILLGLLSYRESWLVSSNRETGDGYSDILIESEDGTGIIVEVKYSKDEEHFDQDLTEALAQIERMDYEEVLRDHGVEHILKYGIACCKKHCKVIKK